MGAVLGMGKNLHFVQPEDGSDRLEITGEPFEVTNMAYSSGAEVKALAERTLGIPPSYWPFYTEIDLEWDVPLEDARLKCAHLREVFSRHSPADLPDDYWLRFLADLLRREWDFYTHL